MQKKEREELIEMVERDGVEVIRTGRKYITVRVRDINGNPQVKRLLMDSIDETTFIGA